MTNFRCQCGQQIAVNKLNTHIEKGECGHHQQQVAQAI